MLTGSDGFIDGTVLRNKRFTVPCEVKARYVWIDLGDSTERLIIAEIEVMSEEVVGFGWTNAQGVPAKGGPYGQSGSFSNDYLIQAHVTPYNQHKWELLLPSGKYHVVVGLGWASTKFTAGIKIEGIAAFGTTSSDIASQTLTNYEFYNIEKDVMVSDNKLTLEFTNSKTKLTYIRVFTDAYELINDYSMASLKGLNNVVRWPQLNTCNGGSTDFCPVGFEIGQSFVSSVFEKVGVDKQYDALGPFDAASLEKILKFENLGLHDSVRLTMRYWAVDSWDSNREFGTWNPSSTNQPT